MGCRETQRRLSFRNVQKLAIFLSYRQAEWKRRIDVFTAFTTGAPDSHFTSGSGAGPQGRGNNDSRTRLRKIRKESSCRGSLRPQKNSAKKQRSKEGGSKVKKTPAAAEAGGGWR